MNQELYHFKTPQPSALAIQQSTPDPKVQSAGTLPRVLRRLRDLAHWRCKEPVLIFESDDWGLYRKESSAFVQDFGTPDERADEALETVEDLEQLFQTLERFRDPTGRSACFVGNFVVAYPDFEAIERDQYMAYHDVPIARWSSKELQQKWREGLARKVFHPQYHGRAHFWPELWLKDLRTNEPGARELFAARRHGGLTLLEAHRKRYHSEYVNWSTHERRSGKELLDWVRSGLDFFQQAFGISSASTIAPHYIFAGETCKAWQQAGIRFVQGAGTQRRPYANTESSSYIRHALGERSAEGLLFLVRTVHFDPRPTRLHQGFDAALGLIKEGFRQHVPAVVDTHRIGYTGIFRDDGLRTLSALLNSLQEYQPYVLTTVELGEAINRNGTYHDVWTGEKRQLTPLDTPFSRALRLFFRYYNASLESQTIQAQ